MVEKEKEADLSDRKCSTEEFDGTFNCNYL